MLTAFDQLIVLDLTSNVAGPYATLVLCDLGAEVWKVEGLGGDVVRGWPPFRDQLSTTFASLNRGKRSIALDLKRLAGREALTALVRRADVVIENMRPGSFAALGFAWERIHELNPRAVYCSMTAYGSAGPRAGDPGFDAIIQAHSGLLNLTGHPDQQPARVGTGVIDFGTGMWAVIGVLAAVLEREHTGVGCQVEATLFGTSVAFMVHHLASIVLAGVVPRRLGTAQHNSAPYQAIQARDALVMIGVANDRLWRSFCAVVDDGRLADQADLATNVGRVANRESMIVAINALTREMPAQELVAALTQQGVPASVIRDISELPSDPQVSALQLLQRWGPDLELGVIPIRVGAGRVQAEGGVPQLGEHTGSLLAAAGYPVDQIRELLADGVVLAADASVDGARSPVPPIMR